MNEKEVEAFEAFVKANGNESLTYVEDSLVVKAFKAGLEAAKATK